MDMYYGFAGGFVEKNKDTIKFPNDGLPIIQFVRWPDQWHCQIVSNHKNVLAVQISRPTSFKYVTTKFVAYPTHYIEMAW